MVKQSTFERHKAALLAHLAAVESVATELTALERACADDNVTTPFSDVMLVMTSCPRCGYATLDQRVWQVIDCLHHIHRAPVEETVAWLRSLTLGEQFIAD